MIRAHVVQDPADIVRAVAAGVDENQPYTDPSAAERDSAVLGLTRLLIGNTAGGAALLAHTGFAVTAAEDPVTGRGYVLALSETTTPRAWGLYLIDASAPPRLAIAVPHPKSDTRCERLALRLWRAVPGSILLLSAVHRAVSDAAQDTASVFHHLWTDVLGPWGVPQLQIHGFADATAPEQVAVSTGAAPVNPAAERIAAAVAGTGLRTTRNWDGTADVDLRATTNRQGIAARDNGWTWAHLEHSHQVRYTTALWQPAIDAVAATHPGLPG